MRWLLLKDLQILRRSPMLVAILIAYPAIISVLIGLALSREPDKPRVAFVNEVPAGERTFQVGSQRIDATRYAGRLFEAIEPVRVDTRAAAVARVRDGDVLGALIVPADVTRRLQDAINLTGSSRRPTLEVVYNIEDPIKAQIVESTIKSRLADANQALSEQLTTLAARYLDIITRGGDFSILGRRFDVLGLERSRAMLGQALRRLPPGSREADGVRRVMDFAQVAIANLDLSRPVLASVGQPIAVRRTVLEGRNTPLDAFAVAVSVTISLMFVTVLLAAGMLALEREDHAFARLVRGLVSRLGLLVEKIALSAGCAFAATLLMLCGIGLFVDLDWGRFALWIAALAAGAIAFGAMGVAVGAVAREVRAASLLAFLLALPVAFLALVPAGAVAGSLYDAMRVVSALFPFRPALEAVDAALNGAEPGFGPALAHLAILAAAYLAIARAALARFA
ncbi:MAG TPA: ABC transporter permease [Solirubrobacteraceae bacterium]|nr:ABC transporter permease [Solirubrobacteraceae bacterium]